MFVEFTSWYTKQPVYVNAQMVSTVEQNKGLGYTAVAFGDGDRDEGYIALIESVEQVVNALTAALHSWRVGAEPKYYPTPINVSSPTPHKTVDIEALKEGLANDRQRVEDSLR